MLYVWNPPLYICFVAIQREHTSFVSVNQDPIFAPLQARQSLFSLHDAVTRASIFT